MSGKGLKSLSIRIYQECIYISGFATLFLGLLMTFKAIQSSAWWLGYILILVGCIVIIGQLMSKFKIGFKKQNISLKERIAQEEQRNALQNKTAS